LLKDQFDVIKKEMLIVGIVVIVLAAAVKIAFYNEPLMDSLRISLSLVWLFLLPGYCLLLFWRAQLAIIERIIIGFLLAAGIEALTSYYLGIGGVNVNIHHFVLPLALITIGLAAYFFGSSTKSDSRQM